MGGRPVENRSHDVTSFIVPGIPPTYNERKPIWINMRRAGMSYRQIGEASGVNEITVRRDIKASTATNVAVDLPANR